MTARPPAGQAGKRGVWPGIQQLPLAAGPGGQNRSLPSEQKGLEGWGGGQSREGPLVLVQNNDHPKDLMSTTFDCAKFSTQGGAGTVHTALL